MQRHLFELYKIKKVTSYTYISVPEYKHKLYFSELLVQNKQKRLHEQVTLFSIHFVYHVHLYTIYIFPQFNFSFVFFMDREELIEESWEIVISNSVPQEL